MKPTTGEPCAGCGELTGHYPAEVYVGTNKVAVCSKGYSDYFSGSGTPKKTCTRKAREKARLCPGCGEEGWDPGTICPDCRENIRLGQVASAPAQACYLDRAFLGPYLWEDEGVLELLCRIAAPRGSGRRWAKGLPDWAPWNTKLLGARNSNDRPTTGSFAVELDEDQREAMLSLGEALTRLSKAQRLAGVGEGSSVLHKLMKGEMTVNDINEAQVRANKRYGRDE